MLLQKNHIVIYARYCGTFRAGQQAAICFARHLFSVVDRHFCRGIVADVQGHIVCDPLQPLRKLEKPCL